MQGADLLRWWRGGLAWVTLAVLAWAASVVPSTARGAPLAVPGSAAAGAEAAEGARERITLEIPIFAGGYGTAFYEETARLFEQQRPDVRINLYGDPRIADRLRVRIIDGSPPDAAAVGEVLWPVLIAAGRMRDLARDLAGPAWPEAGAVGAERRSDGATEGRGQSPEAGGQKPEAGGRKSEVRSQRTDVRGTRLEDNGQTADEGGPGVGASLPETAQAETWGETFLPGALDAWRVQGGVYAIPHTYSCWTLFYDRGFFRQHGLEEPRTWGEFFVLCEKIRAAGRAPLAVGGVFLRYLDAFLRAAHYNLIGKEGWEEYLALAPGARMRPELVRAAEVLARLRSHLVQGWEGMTHTVAQRALLEGRAAMTVSGSWMLNEMRGRLPAGFELGAMTFPVFADGVGDPTVLQTSSDYFFVFATGDAAREQATVDFLRFLTSRERALAWVRATDAPVAVRGVPAAAFSPMMQDTVAMIARSRAGVHMPPNMLQPQGLAQALTDLRWRLMQGTIGPAEFGARLEEAAEDVRRRKADPEAVRVRHGGAAAGLGGTMLAVFAWGGWARWRAARQSDGATERQKAEAGGQRAEHGGRKGEGGRGGPVLPGRLAAGFVGPALGVYALFALAPALVALAWGFTRWDGLGERTWAGLFHFRALLLESDVFWVALRNNLFLVVVPVLLVVPVALALAALIHRGVWGGRALRAVVLFPNLLGGVAAALLWLHAYEPHGGLVNAALVALGDAVAGIHGPDTLAAWLRGFDGFAWLAPDRLYPALVPIYLWVAAGFNLVLFLAAMQGIPVELYEAAELDGVSPVRQFFGITLPLIRGTVGVAVVFLVVSGLNAFELIWLLTAQDPPTGSHTLATLLVSTMFKEFDIGRATALAVILCALVLAASAVVLRWVRSEETE